MRIGFLTSNQGGSPLVVGLERGLQQLGHEVVNYRKDHSVELVLLFNQCSHTTEYSYPDFPENVKFAFVDCAEYGYFKRLPETIGQYAHAFTAGSMAHDTKNHVEQTRLKDFLTGKSYPYFLREFSKYVAYPGNYHPIDYPLYHYSECPILPNREEYLSRKLDLFCSWGASHPWRMNLTGAMRSCSMNSEILVLEENGTPRMPQAQYFERTRAAKMSVSFDGYGSSSFRLTEVLVRCLLLVGPLSIVRYAPLVDGVHCVEYHIENEGEQFLYTDICNKLHDALSDPERSYTIHEAGYRHCMEYYTEKATAQYVLDTIDRHDWRNPTNIESVQVQQKAGDRSQKT